MAGTVFSPGQSLTLACSSMTPMACSSTSSSSSSSSSSSASSPSFCYFAPLPSFPSSRGYASSLAGAHAYLSTSGCSCSGRPVRTTRSFALHSSFTSKSMDSRFFNGGAGAILFLSHLAIVGSNGGALGAYMNIFERVVRIVRSYANAIVSSAEDPEKILEQSVIEMNEDLVKMRQASAQVLASQKQLENKYKTAQQNADDWYKRAKLALQKGEENLAREALKRRKDYEDNANALKAQLEQQKTVVDKLISNTRLLESKIQEAKSKKDTLKARAQSAKTASKVNEMLGNINTSSALSAFERMEEKVTALEAEADALNQLNTDDLAGKFALLESNDVDDDLNALKKEMLGSSKRPTELPAGRTAVSSGPYPYKDVEIEKELNELRRKVTDY